MSSCEQHQLACNYILYIYIYLIKLHLPKIQIMDMNIYNYNVIMSQLQECTCMEYYSQFLTGFIYNYSYACTCMHLKQTVFVILIVRVYSKWISSACETQSICAQLCHSYVQAELSYTEQPRVSCCSHFNLEINKYSKHAVHID